MTAMLKTAALAGVAASAAAFAPMGAPSTRAAHRPAVCGLNMQQIKPTGALIKQTFLTPTLFNQVQFINPFSCHRVMPSLSTHAQTFFCSCTPSLIQIDKDGSGTIDLDELKAAVKFTSNASVRDLIQRADLNGDGVIDYGEYERLMNMEVRTGIHAAGALVKQL